MKFLLLVIALIFYTYILKSFFLPLDHKRSNRGKRGLAKRKTYDPNRVPPDNYDANTIKDVIIDAKNNGTKFDKWFKERYSDSTRQS